MSIEVGCLVEVLVIALVIILFAVSSIKLRLVDESTDRAIDYIFSQDNWEELLEEYKPSERFLHNFFHPLKWTYEQMFKGLERE